MSGDRPGKVVLFFPSYASGEISPPLALIAIAGPLLTAGYDVRIIDSGLHPTDFVQRVVRELDGALCLGISIITGPMIHDMLEVCRAARAAHPDLPIVVGGWHASILPEQTLAHPLVDAVVYRQGEEAFLEVCQRLTAGDELAGIAGVYTKDPQGQPVAGPARAYKGVAHLPARIPGYELIDYDAYHRATGLRWVMYTTSHGCPFNCSYCSNASVYGRRFDGMPAEQAVDEIDFLVRRYNIGLLGLIDDIFFCHTDRALAIAEGIVKRGLQVDWYIQDRADSVARLSRSEAQLLRRSGLVRIHFGAESGSDEVLQSIDKKSDVATTLAAVDRCREAGIRASFGFIFGLPDETEDDLKLTVEFIAEIYARNPRADCHTNIFTPYPGSPLWQRSIELGWPEPTTLEDWADLYPRTMVLPWLQGDKHARVQNIRQYLRFGYPTVRVGEDPGSWRHQLALRVLGPTARWRLRNHRYGVPLELVGYRAAQKLKPELQIYERY